MPVLRRWRKRGVLVVIVLGIELQLLSSWSRHGMRIASKRHGQGETLRNVVDIWAVSCRPPARNAVLELPPKGLAVLSDANLEVRLLKVQLANSSPPSRSLTETQQRALNYRDTYA